MPFQFRSKLLVASLTLILCVAVVEAWRADRRDRAQLAAELAATKQLLTTADARQRDRDAQLAQTLSALAAEKRSVATPAQVLRALPKTLPLPEPIALQANHASSVGAALGPPTANASSEARSTEEPLVGARLTSGSGPLAVSGGTTSQANKTTPVEGAFIPSADLKPLYDFTLNCQACQAKLSVAQNDLADEKAKTAALIKERDDAVRLAKGGTAWHRVTRAAKWFLLGAAAGAIASKATR
jgi:hypothetical protein